jgi:hypothetical protein
MPLEGGGNMEDEKGDKGTSERKRKKNRGTAKLIWPHDNWNMRSRNKHHATSP